MTSKELKEEIESLRREIAELKGMISSMQAQRTIVIERQPAVTPYIPIQPSPWPVAPYIGDRPVVWRPTTAGFAT